MDHQEGQADHAPGAVVAQVDIEAPKLSDSRIADRARGSRRREGDGGGLLAEPDAGASMRRHENGRRSDTMRERIRAGDDHHYSQPDKSSGQFIDPADAEQGGRRYAAGGPRGGTRCSISFLVIRR